jgi:hypothetical protein
MNRAQERNIVDVPAEVRKELGDLDSALSVFLKLKGLGISGPGNPCRTITSPCTFPSIGSPAYFASEGFGSNVSTWLQPPPMNSEITAVARGLKCGGFGA